jgi:hypothetical protein
MAIRDEDMPPELAATLADIVRRAHLLCDEADALIGRTQSLRKSAQLIRQRAQQLRREARIAAERDRQKSTVTANVDRDSTPAQTCADA